MRIRSIRPEFLTDPKILDLEDGTAFFYVCLWMACDDAGYFEIDTRSIAAKVARWRPQEVFKHLRRLNEEGMVKVSSTDGVGLVEAWSRHQRMVKPQRSKWEGKEIRWDNVVRPRKKNACRVEESRVEESRVEDFAGESPLPTPVDPKSPTAEIWKAYSNAYFDRYSTEPVRNAKVNGQIAQFAIRIPREEAPLVAAFFVSHNDSFYVKSMHPIGMLLRDAEKLRTEWKTDRPVLGSQARDVERRQHNSSAFAQAAKNLGLT